MSILKLKYKAHKLVNTIFYLLVFIVGFLLGFASEKIDYNKLISQVLMIDNVSAYTIHTYNGYEFNEEFIYNSFKNHWTDFNLDDVSYIACDYYKNPKWYCYAYINSMVGVATSSNSRGIYFSNSPGQVGYNWTFDPTTGQYEYFNPGGTSYFALSSTSTSYVTNFDNFTKHNPNLTYDYSSNNKLDFSGVGVNLEFNENLFEDNPDFKEVCVNDRDSFTITPIIGNYSDNGIYEDFIWFPYGLNNGLFKSQYDSSSEYANGNIIPYSEEIMREHFYFSSKETIDSFYDTDLSSDFEESGYTDKYSYYGYDAYKFFIYYKDGVYRYPIFTFDHPSKTHISSSDTTHGGGGLRLDVDEEIEISSEYCFYVKNDYSVSIVKINEWGDYNGIVSSPDGDYMFKTSKNESNINNQGLFSVITNFSSQMRETISFINSNIYNLYLSMPLLVRMFILSLLTILFIKYLIDMIVR